MAFYDWENGIERPARIIDGEGREWGRLLYLDTETGEAAQLQRNTEMNRIARKVRLPLPIRVEAYGLGSTEQAKDT